MCLRGSRSALGDTSVGEKLVVIFFVNEIQVAKDDHLRARGWRSERKKLISVIFIGYEFNILSIVELNFFRHRKLRATRCHNLGMPERIQKELQTRWPTGGAAEPVGSRNLFGSFIEEYIKCAPTYSALACLQMELQQ